MAESSGAGETVILVHGIWMIGWEMKVLARRLRGEGYHVRQFRYRSVRGTVEENIEALRQFVEETPGATIHFVGHSMGGILTLDFLLRYSPARPGRVVAVAAPFGGSWTAERVRHLGLERWCLGRTLMPLLAAGRKRGTGGREVGVIAGTYPLGIGSLLGGMPGANDGTVLVSETELDGAAASVLFHANHFWLLVSRPAFGSIVRFLRAGKFE